MLGTWVAFCDDASRSGRLRPQLTAGQASSGTLAVLLGEPAVAHLRRASDYNSRMKFSKQAPKRAAKLERRLRPWYALGCAVVGALIAADVGADEPVALVGRTMGTTYQVKYWGEGRATPAEVRQQVDELLERFDRQMSTYRDDSELSRFNRAAAETWIEASPETAYVAARALEFQKQTGGAMDVTVGPLVRLWGFGGGATKAAESLEPPTEAQLRAAMKHVGPGRVSVRTSPPALRKDADGVEVDLSAIAPGYAVDLIVERLRSLGFANAMVEIGGEVRAAGTRTDGTPWRVGVEHALATEGGGRRLARVVDLRDMALSTAGDYRNYRTAGGERITHIVDPRTGRALPYRGAAVSVIATTCLESDALDTALLVLGAETGYEWCVEHGVAAMFQTRDADGAVVERATPRFVELTPAE